MSNFKCCSACLVTDVKMFYLSTKPTSKSTCTLGEIFTGFLGIPTLEKYNYICFECARLVCKFQEFKLRCQKAQFKLSTLVEDDPDIIEEVIKNVDCKILTSSKLKFSSMITTNVEINNVKVEFNNEVCTKEFGSVDSIDTKMHSIRDVETIDEVQNFQLNKEVSENVITMVKKNIKTENENTLNKNPIEITQEYNCNDECEMIEEYLESEDETVYYSDTESPKIHNKDLGTRRPKNENTEDSKPVTIIKENKISNAFAFPNEDNSYSTTNVSTKENKVLCNLELKNKNKKAPKSRKEPKAKKRKSTDNKIKEDKNNSSGLKTLISTDSKKESLKGKHERFNAKFFEDFATVVMLTPDEAEKELLLRKESNNYIMCPHKCDLCYKGFGSKTAYENHMKRHTDVYGDFECDLCHLRYHTKRILTRHSLTCHRRKFICKLCQYGSFDMGQARNHVRLHKGKTYSCDDCDQVFSMPNSLLQHKRYKHQTKCVCEFCGDAFATSTGLHLHKNMVHKLDINNKQGPNCEECDTHFATEMAWNKHMVLKHGVSNGCKHCGEMFTNEEELKPHLKIHAYSQAYANIPPKFPVDCNYCEQTLSNSSEYKSHMTSEHPQSDAAKELNEGKPKRFVCETCGKAFSSCSVLSSHQRTHSCEKPFACAECGAAFRHPASRDTHRRAHHQGQRHHCRLCQRAFTHPSNLVKHMKTHLNIRPYKCTMCDKGFINACDRKWHILYVHNKVPWPKKKTRCKRENTE